MYKLLKTQEDCTQKFTKTKRELVNTIDECHSTVDSCLLPTFVKINRLKNLLFTLNLHANFIKSYDAYLSNNQLYDIEVIRYLNVANNAITEFEEIYTDMENNRCL